jgi:hypothetical protein
MQDGALTLRSFFPDFRPPSTPSTPWSMSADETGRTLRHWVLDHHSPGHVERAEWLVDPRPGREQNGGDAVMLSISWLISPPWHRTEKHLVPARHIRRRGIAVLLAHSGPCFDPPVNGYQRILAPHPDSVRHVVSAWLDGQTVNGKQV